MSKIDGYQGIFEAKLKKLIKQIERELDKDKKHRKTKHLKDMLKEARSIKKHLKA